MLQARQRRIDKSKVCNPTFNKEKSNIINENKNKKFNNDGKNKEKKTSLSKKKTADLPEYTGITAKEVNTLNYTFFD